MPPPSKFTCWCRTEYRCRRARTCTDCMYLSILIDENRLDFRDSFSHRQTISSSKSKFSISSLLIYENEMETMCSIETLILRFKIEHLRCEEDSNKSRETSQQYSMVKRISEQLASLKQMKCYLIKLFVCCWVRCYNWTNYRLMMYWGTRCSG